MKIMTKLKHLTFIVPMIFSFNSAASVCETTYDGDKAVEIIKNTPSNYTLNMVTNFQSDGQLTHAQIEAFSRAKDKIQKVAGFYPKYLICGDAEPNAFAFEQADGPVVGVSIGMLKIINGDENLAAAVIGHEIAHHTRNHRFRSQQSELVTNIIASIIGVYVESRVQQRYRVTGVGRDVAIIGSALVLSKFSRDHEREADEVGFQYLVESGYNPEGAIKLANTLANLGGSGHGVFFVSR